MFKSQVAFSPYLYLQVKVSYHPALQFMHKCWLLHTCSLLWNTLAKPL